MFRPPPAKVIESGFFIQAYMLFGAYMSRGAEEEVPCWTFGVMGTC